MSAPCVNAANVPVPCAGKRKREAEAEADPYLVYGLPIELNCKNAWGWPVPCAQEGEAKKKREAEAKPYYGYGYGLPVVSVKTVELEAGKDPWGLHVLCPKKRRGKPRPRLSHTTVTDMVCP